MRLGLLYRCLLYLTAAVFMGGIAVAMFTLIVAMPDYLPSGQGLLNTYEWSWSPLEIVLFCILLMIVSTVAVSADKSTNSDDVELFDYIHHASYKANNHDFRLP